VLGGWEAATGGFAAVNFQCGRLLQWHGVARTSTRGPCCARCATQLLAVPRIFSDVSLCGTATTVVPSGDCNHKFLPAHSSCAFALQRDDPQTNA